VKPVARKTPIGHPAAEDAAPRVGDGIPQPLLPQSPEPAIVIPAPTGPSAPRLASPPTADEGARITNDPRAVAGEIVARAGTAKLYEAPPPAANAAPPVKRATDLGLGPDRPKAAKISDERALAPTAKAGEVVAGPAKDADIRPVRKIILDPAIPEDDAGSRAGAARWSKPLAVGAGLAVAAGIVVVALKLGGHTRHGDETVAGAGPPAEKAAGAGALAADAGLAAASSGDASGATATGEGAGAAKPVAAAPGHAPPSLEVEERMADPKVARELPVEFPRLLAACRQAFTEKRAKDAEAVCGAAKDANPDSAEACALLGHALLNRKKRREALQWAERAVQIDPGHAEAYVIIGGVKQASDDAAAAKAAYKKYLELAPNGQYASDLRAIVNSL
jgi:hypothetical protein